MTRYVRQIPVTIREDKRIFSTRRLFEQSLLSKTKSERKYKDRSLKVINHETGDGSKFNCTLLTRNWDSITHFWTWQPWQSSRASVFQNERLSRKRRRKDCFSWKDIKDRTTRGQRRGKSKVFLEKSVYFSSEKGRENGYDLCCSLSVFSWPLLSTGSIYEKQDTEGGKRLCKSWQEWGSLFSKVERRQIEIHNNVNVIESKKAEQISLLKSVWKRSFLVITCSLSSQIIDSFCRRRFQEEGQMHLLPKLTEGNQRWEVFSSKMSEVSSVIPRSLKRRRSRREV